MPTRIHWVSHQIFVEATDSSRSVWNISI